MVAPAPAPYHGAIHRHFRKVNISATASQSETTPARPFADAGLALLLFAAVMLSRFLTRGELYFADGPRIVQSIVGGYFIIQPPGYWLYAHLGGLFPNPAFGLAFVNEFFSATGAAIFFLLCRKLSVSRTLAFLAALAYASVYFNWFAGVTHSSYATQLFFPPFTVLLFLHHRENPSLLSAILCGLTIGLGTGLRPSDGIFLGALWIFLLLRCVPALQQKLALLATFAIVTACWYIPTKHALANTVYGSAGSRLGHTARSLSPLMVGLVPHSEANIVRIALPLFTAFFALFPLLLSKRRKEDNLLLALWTIPGFLFLLLIYMSDASYLCFATGGVVLLAALAQNRRLATICLGLCFACNTVLYFAARPIYRPGLPVAALNFYVVKYCNFGVRHKWMSTIGGKARVPHD